MAVETAARSATHNERITAGSEQTFACGRNFQQILVDSTGASANFQQIAKLGASMRSVSAALMAVVFCWLVPQVGAAQTCPPNTQARVLEARRDPFGTYCMRVFQAGYAQQKCARARAAIDLDECQYLSELLISSLQDCAALGGVYGTKCSAMIPQAKGMLRAVNADPVLIQHRQEQRGRASAGANCRANLGVQCSARCAGNSSCMAACNGGNAWQCNR